MNAIHPFDLSVFSNVPLWAAFFSWCSAQAIKLAIDFAKTRRVDFRYFVSTGGMPSAHSATVTGLATSLGLTQGWDAPVTAHKRHWQFCVGSGHALLALRTDYTRQLKFIHDTLGIERVRFHGIFCDDMRTFNDLSMMYPIPGGEQFTEYNFNACGVAYDNVLEAGMKPFVELSFMPAKLARKKEGEKQEGSFFYRPMIVPPEDMEAWKAYIRAFLGFLIHRYGIEEIRTWFFEVWN